MEECQALPSSWSSLQDHCTVDEPPPKITNNDDETFLQPREETNFFHNDYGKISLPIQSSDGDHVTNNDNSTKFCHRCYQRSFSDPSAGLKPSRIRAQQQQQQLPLTEAMDSFSSSLMNTCVFPPQCHSKMVPNGLTCSHSAAMPPQHPSLGRSFSSPNPTALMVKTAPQSSNCVGMMVESSREDSAPEFKKMKRMNDRVKEIKHLCNELSREVEDEVTSQEFNTEPTKGWSPLPVVEESVSVEKTGECLAIHFNCPCSKGYQIILSGNNCYYKLM